MFKEFENLKTLADWGEHQFNAALSSVFSWCMLGEQHYLVSKLLLMDCWKAKDEFNLLNKTEYEYGTEEFELIHRIYFYEPASLFMAMSFENFLKGIWIKQCKSNFKDVDSLPKLLKTHDLIDLADHCRLTLTNQENKMLDLLSNFSIWRGKYNLPISREENVKYWKSKSKSDFLLEKYPGDFSFPDEVKTLRAKISQELNFCLI